MQYRCEATTVGGFVQQLAVGYISRGYRFFVTGSIPERKDPRELDEKLVKHYDLALSSAERSRRRAAGRASVQYLRYGRFFVVTATHGKHRFFWPTDLGGESRRDETGHEVRIRDFRHHALRFEGYSIAHRGGRASVRIEREELKRQRAYLLELACSRRSEALELAFRRLPFEPYAPVRSQLIALLAKVNRKRREAGYSRVPISAVRLRRRIYRPFEPVGVGEEGA